MERILKIGVILIFIIIGMIIIPKSVEAVTYKNSSSTTKITINGTDTNYNGNTLTASNVTVKIGGAGVTATVQRSEPIAITNGVQYVLTITNIPTTANGDLTLSIAANTLSDKAGNQNIITSINNTGITIDNIAPTTTATSTTNTASLTSKQTDSASGINSSSIQYGIKKDGTWVWQTSSTFTGLTNNTTYSIKTKVSDKAGNSSESAEGVITTVKAIAKIGTTEYTSLANAITAAGTSGTVTITMINSTSESVTFPSEKTISLALNGYTITGTTTNNGTLTIGGTGTMQATNMQTFLNNGILTIDSGTIKGTNTSVTSTVLMLENNGTLTMNEGTVSAYANDGYGIHTVINEGDFNFNKGTIKLENGSGTAMYNNANNFKMAGGSIDSVEFGLVVHAGRATSTGGSIYIHGNNANVALLVRNEGKCDMVSSTITATNGYSIHNETGNPSNLIIRSRAANYGITGTIRPLIFFATTNTSPGQASEKVTVYNTGREYFLLPVWSDNNGQDDLDWMKSQNSTGTHTYTIYKSNHKNDTGVYIIHAYNSNSSWLGEGSVRGMMSITF